MADLLNQTANLLWPIGAAAFGVAVAVGYYGLRRGGGGRPAKRPDRYGN